MKNKIMAFLSKNIEFLPILIAFVSGYILATNAVYSKYTDKIDDLIIISVEKERVISELEIEVSRRGSILDKLSQQNLEQKQVIEALINELQKRRSWSEGIDPNDAT